MENRVAVLDALNNLLQQQVRNMRYAAALVFFLILFTGAAMAQQPTLVLDSADVPGLPQHFRRCDGPFLKAPPRPLTHTGLENNRFSGSAQFSVLGFEALLREIHANPVIIDLREESHGLLNGMAVSWYSPKNADNTGKTLLQIEIDENQRLAQLVRVGITVITEVHSKEPDGTLGQTSMFTELVKTTQTEKELLAGKGVRYLRLPVTDHRAPSETVVDTFLRFYREHPLDTWLHFHCHAGMGRTTTFMVMADMLTNATLVSAEDIILRQELLGGENLFAIPPQGWKKDFAVERADFIRRFYEYATNNPQGRPQLWSEWLAQKERDSKEGEATR